ncbi:hypothetical protein [Agriterribacter sp.]|uniref:hypothetical protein n=1 Tax=Agriterribacter sp. TaxID=2821509 RepID=UPI002CE2C179|nr:hypothetical protein [Agriterribacter sp.]HRP56639.1 hypothetical protein [Agriterribacter sp.]
MKWKNELYNHEVNPPDQVWARVVHDLDNEFLEFKNRLYHAEIDPPDNSWKLIQHSLDVPSAANRKSFNIKKVFRIAAAAALIGISFFTVNYFIAGSDNSKTTADKKTAPDTTSTYNNQTNQPVAKNEDNTSVPVTVKSMIASHITRKKHETNANAVTGFYSEDKTYSAPPVSSVPDDNTAITDRYDLYQTAAKRIRNLKGEVKEDVSLLDLPNSYFLMTGPNGQSVRVSSKFRNTIQYLNGSSNEELLDVILRESRYWRNQFKEWKEEVGHSTFIPSAENFMDIAELMKLLQQHDNK